MTRKQFLLSILGLATAPVAVKAIAPKPLTISTNVCASGEFLDLGFIRERYGVGAPFLGPQYRYGLDLHNWHPLKIG